MDTNFNKITVPFTIKSTLPKSSPKNNWENIASEDKDKKVEY
ncbi:UNVERIFIED_CONTAM: hypothetical protein O8I53_11755 [Campylobacter lari]